MLTRRILLGAAFAAAATSVSQAQAAAYSRIRIDVSRFRANGAGGYADTVRANLERAMRRHFAGRIGGRGPELVVRINQVQLTAFAGSGGGRKFSSGGGGTDYMEGDALVLSGRTVVKQHPQLLALPPSGAAWYLEDNELRRTAHLCDVYAQWLARAL
jgi:opacity protein-like surface antigen